MDKKCKEAIAIVTINDYLNYGNRLQNYALSLLLSQYGTSYTIKQCFNSKSPLSDFVKLVAHMVREPLVKLYAKIFSNDNALKFRREIKGKEFTKKYIPDDEFSVSVRGGLRSKSGKTISRIVLGSDQIWNYSWISYDDLAIRLGSFASDGMPVISYAASIGLPEVEDDAQHVFQKYLPRLKSISVREDRARELVQSMTGLSATVVLDPTLMIDASTWKQITEGFVPDGDNYVLTYFLGTPTEDQEKTIQSYAKSHGCRIRRILDLRDRETYVAGPVDFVELISKAQYVFTDSYHACCFSILFHKQFTVFKRLNLTNKINMNSRMETLFRLFALNLSVMDKGFAPSVDYDKVDCLLDKYRAASQQWLDQAMKA